VLVDIGRIPELDRIELVPGSPGRARLGARVTMAKVEQSQLLRERATALFEGCSWVGGPQIRNRATLVGNVISAQPAADAAIPLVALDAVLCVATADGEREVPAAEAYLEEGGTALQPNGELVTAILVPLQGREEASAFKRMMRRKALTLPVLNCAVWLRRQGDRLAEARIALGPVAARPLRMPEAEAHLCGGSLNEARIRESAAISAAAAAPRDSVFRGSAAYRKEMTEVMVLEAIQTALSRSARGEATE
jgi:carbon-monoxide dehydrogenase medium subunit